VQECVEAKRLGPPPIAPLQFRRINPRNAGAILMPHNDKRLIEGYLPIEAISKEVSQEKSARIDTQTAVSEPTPCERSFR